MDDPIDNNDDANVEPQQPPLQQQDSDSGFNVDEFAAVTSTTTTTEFHSETTQPTQQQYPDEELTTTTTTTTTITTEKTSLNVTFSSPLVEDTAAVARKRRSHNVDVDDDHVAEYESTAAVARERRSYNVDVDDDHVAEYESSKRRSTTYNFDDDEPVSEYYGGGGGGAPKKEVFEYDTYVDMAGEGASFATAAQLASLNKRNAVLIEAIENLEDKFFDSEDQGMAVQRDLLIAEEESADYKTLIEQRDSQNVQIRKEIDQLGVKLQNETSRFNELDNERRKLENKAALLQGEVDVNARAQAKLEQTLTEIDNLRQKLTSMLNEKGELDQQVNQRQKEVTDLEKRLHSEVLRSREINNRTVTNLEGVIESERKRAQQAIDYVRQTLKAKIRVLEAQVETDRESDTNIKKEKREVARELKQVMRKLQEKKSEVGRDKRKIETLKKQVQSFKDILNKVNTEISSLESKHHSLKREVGTLSTQADGASYINTKLNVLIPNQVRLAIEEEAANLSGTATDKSNLEKEEDLELKVSLGTTTSNRASAVVEEPYFDTSADLNFNDWRRRLQE